MRKHKKSVRYVLIGEHLLQKGFEGKREEPPEKFSG
jgi:hypothetical protein